MYLRRGDGHLALKDGGFVIGETEWSDWDSTTDPCDDVWAGSQVRRLYS
jgi:hypothetical protein